MMYSDMIKDSGPADKFSPFILVVQIRGSKVFYFLMILRETVLETILYGNFASDVAAVHFFLFLYLFFRSHFVAFN